jgi:hypothetical protein
MAWCVMERVDGPCRPENSFIRFEEFLEKYYREEMTEADRAGLFPSSAAGYVTAVSRKFYCEVGTIVDHRVIKPLTPHEFPSEVLLRKNYATLGAWLELQLGIIAVDERLKALIEGLEPGVHRFWPMRLVKPNGQYFPERYYGIVIDRFLDGFLPEATKPEAFTGQISYRVPRTAGKSKYNALVFSEAVTSDSHIWRDRKLTDPNVLISDELKAAIDTAGLKIPTHYQVKTI